MSDLFMVKTQYALGNYQGAINEANKLSISDVAVADEKDALVYLSYVAQGNYGAVLDDINSGSSTSLQSVKILASYLEASLNEQPTSKYVEQINELIASAKNDTAIQVAATIQLQEGNGTEALKLANQIDGINGKALVIQCLLQLNRTDLAQKELDSMISIDEDATLTQIASAWVFMATGGDKIKEAFYIYQEMVDKYTSTAFLLNGLAVCSLLRENYEEAEGFLLEALEKNPKNADTLANLIVCSQYLNKATNRYERELKASHPNHPLSKGLKTFDDSFNRNAARFSS